MTKTEKRQRCQEIIQKYGDLEFISGKDELFLLSLLHDHPFYKLIAGPGIDRVFVKTKRPYNSRGFWIRRINGSVTDFVYNDCITQKATPEGIFKMVMREAVGAELEPVKRRWYGDGIDKQCSECRAPVDFHSCQIVHVKKYREISRLYLIEKKIEDYTALVTESAEHAAGYRFRRYDDKNDWISFYKERAFYRFLCGECIVKLF